MIQFIVTLFEQTKQLVDYYFSIYNMPTHDCIMYIAEFVCRYQKLCMLNHKHVGSVIEISVYNCTIMQYET